MNVQLLQDSVEVLKTNLGGGLLATDIFSTNDYQSVAGWNSNPTACVLFGQIATSMDKSLKDSGFPGLGKYFLLHLVDEKMVIVIPMGNYMWGMLIDGKRVALGLVLNVALPKAISAFEEALIAK
ncbi:MAG: hypothetical protein APR63_10960 [Desulfuromonas sp. SDB]|nr:MAG: hypothetical protein APR63_10960 [Desulfuromonas sp. SDB]